MFGAGIINPLNIRFAPSELAYVLNDSGSKVVFTDCSFAGLLDRARGAGALVDTVVMIDGDSETGASGRFGATLGYEDLVAVGRSVMPPEPDEDDAAVLMYTGGTTGFPKGVLLQQRAEVAQRVPRALRGEGSARNGAFSSSCRCSTQLSSLASSVFQRAGLPR